MKIKEKLNAVDKLTENFLAGRGEFSAFSAITFEENLKKLYAGFKASIEKVRQKVKERIT